MSEPVAPAPAPAPAPTTSAGVDEPMAGYPGVLAAEKIDINGGSTNLIYSAPISDKIVLSHFFYTQIFPYSFAVCHSKELQKASYVHLYDDRLEWNYAKSCCLQITDDPGVLYLDRDVAELQTIPDCCRPMCTHCNCCPTGFDVTGESLMLHSTGTCFFTKGAKFSPYACPLLGCPQMCIGRPMPCLNRIWFFLPNLEDANRLKFEIRKARQALVAAGRAQQLTAAVAPADAAQTR